MNKMFVRNIWTIIYHITFGSTSIFVFSSYVSYVFAKEALYKGAKTSYDDFISYGKLRSSYVFFGVLRWIRMQIGENKL